MISQNEAMSLIGIITVVWVLIGGATSKRSLSKVATKTKASLKCTDAICREHLPKR